MEMEARAGCLIRDCLIVLQMSNQRLKTKLRISGAWRETSKTVKCLARIQWSMQILIQMSETMDT